jgi:hypothetical protein
MSPAIWLAMARDDLRAAELLAEHGLPPLSCMHADHAVEKALRAFHLHRERQEEQEGGIPALAYSDGSPLPAAATAAEWSRHSAVRRLASRFGEDSGWIAAALASLSLRADQRALASEAADAALAREAVQAAHRVLDRITERVYGEA